MYQNSQIKLLKATYYGQGHCDLDVKIDQIERKYKEYSKGCNRFSSNYKNTMEHAFENFKIENLIPRSKGGTLFNEANENLEKIFEQVTKYYETLDSLRNLDFLKEEKKTVVFVGQNGCGKTTLLRSLINITGEDKIGYFPADRLLVIDERYNPERNNDVFTKAYKDTDHVANNMEHPNRTYYIPQQVNQAIALFEKRRMQELELVVKNKLTLDECLTEKILRIWNDLIGDRELYCDGTLKIRLIEGEDYPLKYMSSGEKSIFYFLACILLKERKEFYFIDEPENNLNPSIVAKLWDIIEEYCKESVFVYLTHDSNFVTSRVDSKVFWIEKYDGKEWIHKPLPENDNLPQELMINLVGNKFPVLFCESHDEYKYDDILFKMMFPDFKIVPVAGCDGVIAKVKAYRTVGLPQKAYGIIDSDYKEDEFLNGQKASGIYHFPFLEIENFLMCEEIVQGVIKEYSIDSDNAFNNLKTALKSDLITQKEQWVTRKIGFKLRETFYNRKIKKLKDFSELKKEYQEFQDGVNLETLYQNYMQEINEVISKDCYNTFLRYYDNKGILTKFLPQLRLKNEVPYKNIVFEYFKEHKEILYELRSKYFSGIVST